MAGVFWEYWANDSRLRLEVKAKGTELIEPPPQPISISLTHWERASTTTELLTSAQYLSCYDCVFIQTVERHMEKSVQKRTHLAWICKHKMKIMKMKVSLEFALGIYLDSYELYNPSVTLTPHQLEMSWALASVYVTSSYSSLAAF